MGHLVMSDKERLRKAVFKMVKQKKLTLLLAATQCQLSYRQAHRAYQRYLKPVTLSLFISIVADVIIVNILLANVSYRAIKNVMQGLAPW